MIELNLLPPDLKKKRKKIELPQLPLVPIAALFIGALLILQFILGGLIYLSKKQLASLDKKLEYLAPKKEAFDSSREEVAAISKKVEAVDDLIAKRLNWAQLLNELSDSVTANIWLSDLSYAETKSFNSRIRTLTLSGSAAGKSEETTAHIARFIKSLKENKKFFAEFDNVELVSIRKGQVAGQDVMNFTLACSFKIEEPPKEKPKRK